MITTHSAWNPKLWGRWSPIVLCIWAGILLASSPPPLGAQEPTGDSAIQIIAAPGAKVFLNGEYKGVTNEGEGGLVLIDLASGAYLLRLVQDGYEPLEFDIALKAGATSVIRATTFTPRVKIRHEGEDAGDQLARKVGRLRVSTVPVSAFVRVPQLSIDERKEGDAIVFEEIPVGTYEVSIIFDDGGEFRVDVVISTGDLVDVRVNGVNGRMTTTSLLEATRRAKMREAQVNLIALLRAPEWTEASMSRAAGYASRFGDGAEPCIASTVSNLCAADAFGAWIGGREALAEALSAIGYHFDEAIATIVQAVEAEDWAKVEAISNALLANVKGAATALLEGRLAGLVWGEESIVFTIEADPNTWPKIRYKCRFLEPTWDHPGYLCSLKNRPQANGEFDGTGEFDWDGHQYSESGKMLRLPQADRSRKIKAVPAHFDIKLSRMENDRITLDYTFVCNNYNLVSGLPIVVNASGKWLLDKRCVDVNSAGRDRLDQLPGIGPLLADRILESRRNQGEFNGLKDLVGRVQGLGPSALSRLDGHVCFE